MPKRYVLARSDTGAALSVVSNTYLVVQPKEVLEFYRDLVESRNYTLETAGALDGGRKVWALARTGLVANVACDPEDVVGAYVLLATSCDKSLATTVSFTSIRVVCQNTLHFAFKDIKGESRQHIKVNHSYKFDSQAIKEQLGLLDTAWDAFKQKLNTLSSTSMTDNNVARDFFVRLLTSEKERTSGSIPSTKLAELEQLMSCFRHSSPGRQLVSAKDNLWGLVNAVTYYVDHLKEVRGDRQDNAWFGTGAALKERAFDLAMSMCGSTSGK
jgi:phage/plasmid-like protein (TIGR03299 family)